MNIPHVVELILYLEMAEGAKAVVIFVAHLSMILKPAWLPTQLKASWEVFLHAAFLCVLIETWEAKEAASSWGADSKKEDQHLVTF